MAEETKRRGLGRGLSALIGNDDVAPAAGPARPAADREIAIDLLGPSPLQPRRSFDEAKLEELAASIRARGVLQPILVRPAPEPGRYEIVAGERRWRAAQRAQLHVVPVVVRAASDAETLELAIIENVQRADLNPIEEAAGYRRLMDEFSHTQDALARLLGKSRSHVANTMRLLALPDTVLTLVRDGRLSAGHARALIGAADPAGLAQHIVERGLTVRQAEALARATAERKPAAKRAGSAKDADTRALEGDLSAALGFRVTIEHRGDAGELRIAYRSLDQLDALCGILSAVR